MVKSTLITQMKNVKNITPNPAGSALEAFNLLVNAHKEYQITAQVEQTKRAAITAWKDSRLASLQNQREVLHQYLEHTFAERRHAIDEMFKRLDEGIENGNLDVINLAMNSIVSIVKTSPLQQAEQLIIAMNDPNVHKIEF